MCQELEDHSHDRDLQDHLNVCKSFEYQLEEPKALDFVRIGDDSDATLSSAKGITGINGVFVGQHENDVIIVDAVLLQDVIEAHSNHHVIIIEPITRRRDNHGILSCLVWQGKRRKSHEQQHKNSTRVFLTHSFYGVMDGIQLVATVLLE